MRHRWPLTLQFIRASNRLSRCRRRSALSELDSRFRRRSPARACRCQPTHSPRRTARPQTARRTAHDRHDDGREPRMAVLRSDSRAGRHPAIGRDGGGADRTARLPSGEQSVGVRARRRPPGAGGAPRSRPHARRRVERQRHAAAHMDRIGLAADVDIVIDSCDEGVEKPDPRLFEIALERAGARPESTIHVGDLVSGRRRRRPGGGRAPGAARRNRACIPTLTAIACRRWRSWSIRSGAGMF